MADEHSPKRTPVHTSGKRFAKTVAEIAFASREECEHWLAKRGWRVRYWDSDGSFTTEPIPPDDRTTGRVGSG